MKLHMRKLEHDYTKETSKEKLSFFVIATQNKAIRPNYIKPKVMIHNRIANVDYTEKQLIT